MGAVWDAVSSQRVGSSSRPENQVRKFHLRNESSFVSGPLDAEGHRPDVSSVYATKRPLHIADSSCGYAAGTQVGTLALGCLTQNPLSMMTDKALSL